MTKKSRIASLCKIWCVCLSDGETKRITERERERESARQRTRSQENLNVDRVEDG